MAAYVIADITINDQNQYAEYRAKVPATVAKHGGRFLVRGGSHESLEGPWHPGRVVVIEFPDLAAAKAWYASEEYGPLIKLRQSASTGSVLVVEGA